MDPARHRRMQQLFEQVRVLPYEGRRPWLEKQCPGDPTMVEDVLRLVKHSEEVSTAFLAGASPPGAETPNEAKTRLPGEKPSEPKGSSDTHKYPRLPRYVIDGIIDAGGMGVVYLGRSLVGNRQVAIKLMQGSLSPAETRQRFDQEMALHGKLAHPNVATLLDMDFTENGEPFFVMEYVRGMPIDKYCQANQLSTDERLRLFLKVCEGIQHVHQNLIAHRDIKPSNILVTAEGEPKVLDFGIAKMTNTAFQAKPDPDLTRRGGTPRTPAYASPEQIRGENHQQVRTDIYSLGVLLYQLLTGQWPYRIPPGNVNLIERAILEIEPEKPSAAISRDHAFVPWEKTGELSPATTSGLGTTPSRLRSRLRGDLDNILLKALHKVPRLRYASVDQFSEDIRRHMANEPVIARPPSIRYLASKFIRRNRALVAAGALLLITLVGGAYVSTREWRRAEAALTAARDAQAETETISNTLWATSTTLITTIDSRLRKIEGATKTREEIATIAAEQLEGLRKSRPSDPALLRDLSNSLRVLGDALGGPRSPNQGDLGKALALQEQALEIRQSLLDSEPDNPVWMTLVGESHLCLGDLRRFSDKFSQAVDHYERAVPLLEKASQDVKSADSARARLGSVLAGLSECALELGDNERALDAHRRAQAIREERAHDSSDPLARRNVSVGLMDEAKILTLQGNSAEAIEVLERVVPMRRESLRETAADARRRRDLAEALRALAFAYLTNDDARSALEPAEEAVRIIESLAADETEASGGDSSDQRVWHTKATALLTLAEAARLTGDATRAETNFNLVIDATAPKLNASAGSVAARKWWLEASLGLAQVMLAQRRASEAENLLTRSLDVSVADSAMNEVTPSEAALSANLRSLLADAIEAQCAEQGGAGQVTCGAKVKAQRERALKAYLQLQDAGTLPARFKGNAAALAESLNDGGLR